MGCDSLAFSARGVGEQLDHFRSTCAPADWLNNHVGQEKRERRRWRSLGAWCKSREEELLTHRRGTMSTNEPLGVGCCLWFGPPHPTCRGVGQQSLGEIPSLFSECSTSVVQYPRASPPSCPPGVTCHALVPCFHETVSAAHRQHPGFFGRLAEPSLRVPLVHVRTMRKGKMCGAAFTVRISGLNDERQQGTLGLNLSDRDRAGRVLHGAARRGIGI